MNLRALFAGLNWKGFGNHVGGGALVGALTALAAGQNNGKAIFAAAASGAAIAAKSYIKQPLTDAAQAEAASILKNSAPPTLPGNVQL